MTYSAVIFDLDGTLVNTIPLIVASFQHAHREVLGQELAPETCLPWIGRTLPDIYSAWPDHAQQLFDTFLAYNYDRIPTEQLNYDGAVEMVQGLRKAGLRVAVVTSKRQASARRSLEAAGLVDDVELLIALEDTARHKPHPEPLLLCAERLGLPVSACVYVGDALTDLEAAAAATMDAVGVTWGATAPALMATRGDARLIADHPRDITSFVTFR